MIEPGYVPIAPVDPITTVPMPVEDEITAIKQYIEEGRKKKKFTAKQVRQLEKMLQDRLGVLGPTGRIRSPVQNRRVTRGFDELLNFITPGVHDVPPLNPGPTQADTARDADNMLLREAQRIINEKSAAERPTAMDGVIEDFKEVAPNMQGIMQARNRAANDATVSRNPYDTGRAPRSLPENIQKPPYLQRGQGVPLMPEVLSNFDESGNFTGETRRSEGSIARNPYDRKGTPIPISPEILSNFDETGEFIPGRYKTLDEAKPKQGIKSDSEHYGYDIWQGEETPRYDSLPTLPNLNGLMQFLFPGGVSDDIYSHTDHGRPGGDESIPSNKVEETNPSITGGETRDITAGLSRNPYETQKGVVPERSVLELAPTEQEPVPTTAPVPHSTKVVELMKPKGEEFSLGKMLTDVLASAGSGRGMGKMEAFLSGFQNYENRKAGQLQAKLDASKAEKAEARLDAEERRKDARLALDHSKFNMDSRMEELKALKMEGEIRKLRNSGLDDGTIIKLTEMAARSAREEMANDPLLIDATDEEFRQLYKKHFDIIVGLYRSNSVPLAPQ